MKELEEYIKRWNLVFTKTCDRLDFCIIGFDVNKQEVNYENSISLYELITTFNNLYVEFEREFSELKKHPLGKKMEYIDFSKFKNSEDLLRVLILYLEGNTLTNHKKTILYLREVNGLMRPFVTNNVSLLDSNYYNEEVYIDEDIAKQYLDLFEKYKPLFDMYYNLKNNFIYGDGTYTLISAIDNTSSNILEGLKEISLYMGANYFESENYIKIYLNLGTEFGINYDKCEVKLDDEEKVLPATLIDKSFKEIHINQDFTRKRKN